MPDKEEWIKATDAEIASLIELGTWELVPPPNAVHDNSPYKVRR
jgi:hypothetical protein